LSETFNVSVLTAEGELYNQAAESVVVPAAEGELGVLARHSPLVAILKPGPLRVTTGADEEVFFVSGGFVDVALEDGKTQVTVLADSGERAHDIDEARAEEARKRAKELLSQKLSDEDYAEASALLERSVARVRVAELSRRRRSGRERPVR
jgi:F-type H+-transporting ATPase subunit epsilon